MTAFRLKAFGGMLPQVEDRLLPDLAAAYSNGTLIGDGSLRGFRPKTELRTVSGTTKKVFRIPNTLASDPLGDFSNSTWLEFSDRDTDVLRTPVSADSFKRFYWCSPSMPPRYNTLARIQGGQASFKLGLQAPSSAPSATATGGVSTTAFSRAYVYTRISAYGEESPPSPPYLINGKEDDTVTVTIPAATSGETTDRNLSKTRLYRTVTGRSGVASYFMVAEWTDLAQIVHGDTSSDAAVSLNNQLESTTWQPPPTLKGMVMMPHGMIAGWSDDSDIWFCEPYRPHAWPTEYGLTVDSPIVGLGVTGNSLVVATRGNPVVISGIHPAGMSQVKLGQNEPCLSRRSIVSTERGVFFASLNGLVAVTPGGAVSVTAGAVDKEMWVNDVIGGEQVQAVRHENAYLACPIGVIARDGFLLDAGTVGFNWVEFGGDLTSLFQDFYSGETLLIQGSKVWMFNPPNVTTGMSSFTWKSKIFTLPFPANLGAMRASFTVPAGTPTLNPVENTALVQDLAADQYAIVKVYADGVHKFTRELRTSGKVFHSLPGGFKATEWQFEVQSRVIVHSLEIASTPRELRNV